jgi:TatD DNase family protein
VGINGIMTFTKKQEQLDAAKHIPRDRLLLETDAPYLTPSPYRGRVCESKYVRVTADFLASLYDTNLTEIAESSTRNAQTLFVF